MSNLQSILYELKPCDSGNPYIFISYSSHDSELVWRDALEFQKRGYNVWLDEKNLDKTKPSWREDAIAAIEDMECELVVFYVSSNSLRSDACYQELSKTVDERTRAMHFGPVKFIAVDAEPVGDITSFAQKVFLGIRKSGLPKEERNRQALALDGFMRDFFNSNNEKVRIHPKNEVNRKIDYYDDITASFPDAARVFDPEPEQPEKSPEEASTEPDVPEQSEASGDVWRIPDAVQDIVSPEPDIVSPEPDIVSPEPDIVSPEPNIVSPEPDIVSPEPDIVSPEPDIVSPEPDIVSPEPDIVSPEPDIVSPEPDIVSPEPDACESDTIYRFTKPEGNNSSAVPERKTFGKKEVQSTPIRRGTLEIPEGYSGIQIKLGHSLYWGNPDIVNLILPDSMSGLNIGEFQKCSNLKMVRLPKYLAMLPPDVFRDCSALKEITIPGNVTSIGSSAFKGCSSLKNVILPEGLLSIDMSAFEKCSSLKEVYLPPQLQKMEMSCFQGCCSLKSVTIPGSVKRIPISAFEGCSCLRTVIIEEGVEKIDSAFEKCGTGRMQVWIPDSVTSISSIAFSKSTPTIHCSKGSYAEAYAKKNSYYCVRTGQPEG